MIHPHPFAYKKVAVLGLGKSGLSAVRALLSVKAEVFAWDDHEKSRAQLEGLIEPCNLLEVNWSEMDLLVMSPGIPHTFPKPHPVAERARAHNCAIVCDVELLVQSHPQAKYIAITGTNGKSTTTALIHHILEECGFDVQIGGNFGIAVMDLKTPDHESVLILEMSSYQLERTPSLVSDIALFLNISPDHLDRHGDMAGYIQAKENIFTAQTKDHFAFIGVDDDASLGVFERHKNDPAHVIALSSQDPVNDGVYVKEGWLYDGAFGEDRKALLDLNPVKTLPGHHNWQNAAAAYGAAIAAGADQRDILKAICRFPGLAHRQEWIRTIDNVSFVNDSKATNGDAAQKALRSYDNIFWICGGVAKDGGLDALEKELSNVRKTYLIGQSAEAFDAFLSPHVATEICTTLDKAVQKAFGDAHGYLDRDCVVLLSPACASFDQYPNFEARGEAFRKLVHALEEEAA